MNIGGKKRENTENSDYSKRVGLFAAKVIAINPTAEQYKNLLNIELKEDSKATEYLGTNNDGNDYLRVDVWLEEVKDGNKFKKTFFLEDKVRENKDGSFEYSIITNRYKKKPAKSPDGMFEEIKVPNNLQEVVNKIKEYYN